MDSLFLSTDNYNLVTLKILTHLQLLHTVYIIIYHNYNHFILYYISKL